MTIKGGENPPETVPKPHKTLSLVKRETLAIIIIILSRVCCGEQVWLRWPVITCLVSATNSENRHAIYDKSSKFCSDLNLNMNFLSGGGLQKIPRKHLVLISSILESDPGLMISSGSYHWL